MKTKFLNFILGCVSLVIGFAITFGVTYVHFKNLEDVFLTSLVSGLMSMVIALLLYIVCSQLEKMVAAECYGTVVDRINDYHECVLKVRDNSSQEIVTINIDEEEFYGDKFRIGSPVGYKIEEGTLTGEIVINLV